MFYPFIEYFNDCFSNHNQPAMDFSTFSFIELAFACSIPALFVFYTLTRYGRSWASAEIFKCYKLALTQVNDATQLLPKPVQIQYISGKNRNLYSHIRTLLADLTDQEMVRSYAVLQNKLIALSKYPSLQTFHNHRYLEELSRIAIRSGQASRLIRACLDEEYLAKNGVYAVIEKNFSEFAEGDFRFFDIECNQPGKRFSPETEYDLLITSMLLLMESTFMRTPTSISFYLCYTGSRVTLHLLDNDDTESNLYLNVIPKEKWPPCYTLVTHIAEEYHGRVIIDPTITKGISIEMILSLPDQGGQWITYKDS